MPRISAEELLRRWDTLKYASTSAARKIAGWYSTVCGDDLTFLLSCCCSIIFVQGFPSAMVASDVRDLQNGAVMSELCDVVRKEQPEVNCL